MNILNSLPLFGVILGLFLMLLILFDKGAHGQNKGAKITLSSIIFLNVLLLTESFLFSNNLVEWKDLGLSYLTYHFFGPLFFLYTYYLLKLEFNIKIWSFAILAYTVLRIAVLLPYSTEFTDDHNAELTTDDIVWIVDYFLSILLNIIFLVLSYLQLKKSVFLVRLGAQEKLNYVWLKNLVIAAIIAYVAIFQNVLVGFFNRDELSFHLSIDSLINSAFCLAIAFFAIRFPVFSVHGNFQDLPVETKEKYANSSLKAETTNELWTSIESVMETEKLYRNPKLRLNDLAEKVDSSIHHVSQIINQKLDISFSDFVNHYRVKEAQALLVSPRAEEITIFAIALEVGFNSKTAFYNSFKKITGKTPSAYKKEQLS